MAGSTARTPASYGVSRDGLIGQLHFDWKEVDCFLRPQAIQCERLAAGHGLMLLFLASTYRVFGLGEFTVSAKSHFDFARQIFAPVSGIQLDVRHLAAHVDIGPTLRSLLAAHGSCIVPANLRRLPYFNEYDRTDRRHFFLVDGYVAETDTYRVFDTLHLSADHMVVEYADKDLPSELLEKLAIEYWNVFVRGAFPKHPGEATLWVAAFEPPPYLPTRDREALRLVISEYRRAVADVVAGARNWLGPDARRLLELEALARSGAPRELPKAMRLYLAEANFADVHLKILLHAVSIHGPSRHEELRTLVKEWQSAASRCRNNLLIAAMAPSGASPQIWREARESLNSRAVNLARALYGRVSGLADPSP